MEGERNEENEKEQEEQGEHDRKEPVKKDPKDARAHFRGGFDVLRVHVIEHLIGKFFLIHFGHSMRAFRRRARIRVSVFSVLAFVKPYIRAISGMLFPYQ